MLTIEKVCFNNLKILLYLRFYIKLLFQLSNLGYNYYELDKIKLGGTYE